MASPFSTFLCKKWKLMKTYIIILKKDWCFVRSGRCIWAASPLCQFSLQTHPAVSTVFSSNSSFSKQYHIFNSDLLFWAHLNLNDLNLNMAKTGVSNITKDKFLNHLMQGKKETIILKEQSKHSKIKTIFCYRIESTTLNDIINC